MQQAKPTLPRADHERRSSGAGGICRRPDGRSQWFKRGRIQGMDTKGSTQIIKAQVPMADMLSYQNDLISMTQGRASFQMEFSHYDYVPSLQADKIIAAAKAAKTGEEEEEE